jgi:hypothetical protein
MTALYTWQYHWMPIVNNCRITSLQWTEARLGRWYSIHQNAMYWGYIIQMETSHHISLPHWRAGTWDSQPQFLPRSRTHQHTFMGYTHQQANTSLRFLRRRLGSCPINIKRQAYLGLARPHLEYASSVWDPYHQKHIHQLEMVQWRSARFIGHMYSRQPGKEITFMEELNLPTLQERRKTSCLLLFHKVIHQRVAIPIPDYLQQPSTAICETRFTWRTKKKTAS